MAEKKYRIGLDIGIGSVGWAVISHEDQEKARIEDFGSRIFDSGELSRGKDRKSQERRGFRSARRLVRRRYHRKERLKKYLIHIGFLTRSEIEEAVAYPEQDILSLKVRALSDNIGKKGLLYTLLHTCNHRGYRDFYDYESDAENIADQEDTAEDRETHQAVQELDQAYLKSGCRSISEYILQYCKQEDGQLNFRNHPYKIKRTVINRKHLAKEIKEILSVQKPFHRELTDDSCRMIYDIIFSQRYFEDGPGHKDDTTRRYTGFLDKLGKCPFYPRQRRGFRNTILADVYAVINALSQYHYVSEDHMMNLPSKAASELVDTVLKEAKINMTMIKSILKKYGIQVRKSPDLKDSALTNAIKFLRPVKRVADETGMDWNDLLGTDPLSWENPPLLHRIGETLAKYKTPDYRKRELKKLINNEEFTAKLIRIPFSGSSAVSYHYMHDAIESFQEGNPYGNFQADRISSNKNSVITTEDKRQSLLSPAILEDDEDIRDNPVVFRAINETRKVVNAIIRIYGAPECINVEVGSELGRSFVERKNIEKRNAENKKRRELDREKISQILNCKTEDVREAQIDRYRLYEEQGGKCLYSGDTIEIKEALATQGAYEIDHIIPYSLILDNTLQNKALVKSSENQRKGQRTPLMYLKGQDRDAFIERINGMRDHKKNPLTRKKYQYLMQETLYGEEAESLLRDWKSRNINDMRYITRYVANYLKNNLLFIDRPRVNQIKGSITSRFRRIWLKGSKWGEEEKDRETHLHHAVDAVILANLTPAYIEVASDNMRLQQIFRSHKKVETEEYSDYMERAVRKMEKYYGFSKEYTMKLLRNKDRIPSLIKNLRDEIDIRFNDEDEELFERQVATFYQNDPDFIYAPHMPLTSHKVEKRFRGAVADSNPIKVREIEGIPHKIIRTNVNTISLKDMDKIYTNDVKMKDFMMQILSGKPSGYTIGKYLEENGMECLFMPNGQRIRKVSKDAGVISNFYQKTINGSNYSYLGMAKYYCIDFYENTKGDLCSLGIRYVDVVKGGKKLKLKQEALPSDYKTHLLYLFPGEFIEILGKNGAMLKKGFYKSVKNISRNQFNVELNNQKATESVPIVKNKYIRKRYIDILGHLGGEIRCNDPSSCIQAKRS